jgi:hypothetical protein
MEPERLIVNCGAFVNTRINTGDFDAMGHPIRRFYRAAKYQIEPHYNSSEEQHTWQKV